MKLVVWLTVIESTMALHGRDHRCAPNPKAPSRERMSKAWTKVGRGRIDCPESAFPSMRWPCSGDNAPSRLLHAYDHNSSIGYLPASRSSKVPLDAISVVKKHTSWIP